MTASTLARPLCIAHRGASGLWPENTMGAFQRSLDMGVDGFELDIHLTRDGQLVVHHDAALKPAIARLNGEWVSKPTPLLKNLSRDELNAYDVGRLRPGSTYGQRYPEQTPLDGEHIPLLSEVLDLVKHKAGPAFRLYVELKTELVDTELGADPKQLAEAAVDLIEAMDMGAATTFVSFDWRGLLRAKELAPHIRNAFTTLPFDQMNPHHSEAGTAGESVTSKTLRAMMSAGPAFLGPYDWRDQSAVTFGERILETLHASSADGWFAWYGDVTPESFAYARNLGLDVSTWTVDEPSDIKRLSDLGVQAILTDRPDHFDL
ncbi:MAG: glycerophosphodiester phosphodiesterase family protein [Parvibaculaceae bacterium]|jgi:glycerophosphoryl diester phosphodiesterase|nr:glycerophosphodiester phosphodiesterase family protein [Parvibaculaceae bacterium]